MAARKIVLAEPSLIRVAGTFATKKQQRQYLALYFATLQAVLDYTFPHYFSQCYTSPHTTPHPLYITQHLHYIVSDCTILHFTRADCAKFHECALVYTRLLYRALRCAAQHHITLNYIVMHRTVLYDKCYIVFYIALLYAT